MALPVMPALEFDMEPPAGAAQAAVTNQFVVTSSYQSVKVDGVRFRVASAMATGAFPMPDVDSFVERKLFGPSQLQGNAVLEALHFTSAEYVCNRLSTQYPVHVPFAMYAPPTRSADRLPRARFMQFHVDALFWVARRDASAEGGVALVEYKTLAENRADLVHMRLNDRGTILQTLFNAWVFQMHTGVKVKHCVVIYLTRRRRDNDAYAAACSFDPNQPVLEAARCALMPLMEHPLAGILMLFALSSSHSSHLVF